MKAERPTTDNRAEFIAAERPREVFSRQLMLGDTLDTERVQADYNAGVPRIQIPVAERAKPRKITVGTQGDRHVIDSTSEDRQPATV